MRLRGAQRGARGSQAGRQLGLLLTLILLALAVSAPAVGLDVGPLSGEVRVLEELPRVRPDYAVPDEPNLLGYIQLSFSRDTVVYVGHTDGNGGFDPDEPVEIFWRRFSDNGHRDSLNFLERNVLFGVSLDPVDGGSDAYRGHFVIYPSRKGILRVNENGRPEAITEIGGRKARLIYAYVDVDISGLIPRFNHADIFGLDLKSGKVIHERIRPASRSRQIQTHR